jgi:serine/threonine-protein kinase
MGSIDTTCSLSNYIGPASQTSSVKISIRLKQKDASGAEVYTPLISPRLVVGSQDIPVVFPRIKGAYGVENGTVEVVDVEKDTVIASYPVSFFPVG